VARCYCRQSRIVVTSLMSSRAKWILPTLSRSVERVEVAVQLLSQQLLCILMTSVAVTVIQSKGAHGVLWNIPVEDVLAFAGASMPKRFWAEALHPGVRCQVRCQVLCYRVAAGASAMSHDSRHCENTNLIPEPAILAVYARCQHACGNVPSLGVKSHLNQCCARVIFLAARRSSASDPVN
jgi:hypothetical protein